MKAQMIRETPRPQVRSPAAHRSLRVPMLSVADQREKTPGGGASGKGVLNRIEAGGADCSSVSLGLAVTGGSEIGGFLGGSTTVCGRCSLRVAALIFFLGALAVFFGILSCGITGAASGPLSGNAPPSPTKFVSNHWEKLTLRSLIAAHPARPMLADTVIERRATRAQTPIDNPCGRQQGKPS